MGRQARGRKRSARGHGGRTRGDAGHPATPEPESVPTEPSVSELVARAQALRQTAVVLCRHMEELAQQMDAVAARAGRTR
jgi:hypothetical protein